MVVLSKISARVIPDPTNPDRPTLGLWFFGHQTSTPPDAILTISSLYSAGSRRAIADGLSRAFEKIEIPDRTESSLDTIKSIVSLLCRIAIQAQLAAEGTPEVQFAKETQLMVYGLFNSLSPS
jgi:hypothetical protein